tara:strand:- start:241 stop:828 length:588 start_codon:yes stop_codon:yes gene_type:complete
MSEKQSYNLKDYILHLNNWISKDICQKSIEELDKDNNWHRHNWVNSKSYEIFHTKEEQLYMNTTYKLTYIKELYDLTWSALNKYIVLDKIGGDYFKGWKGFSEIRFNRYDKKQQITKHVDHIHSCFDGKTKGIPILSIVAVLNDNYEGGEFIMFDDYEIKFKAGDLIIFPSVFLYPHLVKRVKKGIRYSFVSWCY